MAFCILKFITGWTSVAINIKTITTIQIFVQDDFRGQVIGTLTAVSYVMQFLFYLDQLKGLGFSIDVKRPPIMPAQRFQKRKSRNWQKMSESKEETLY